MMFTILYDPTNTKYQVVWHHKGKRKVVASFDTFEEAKNHAWRKY